jgi:hypothetical protein
LFNVVRGLAHVWKRDDKIVSKALIGFDSSYSELKEERKTRRPDGPIRSQQ